MNNRFFFGMKVSMNEEIGVVVHRTGNSDWDNEPGIIKWDTDKKVDFEDWRGLFGSFKQAGGKEIDSKVEFEFIDTNGELKN